MSNGVDACFSQQFEQLREAIVSFNKKGDLQGLFSCHVLIEHPEFNVKWTVTCDDKEWLETKLDRSNLYHLASLGYSIYISKKNSSETQARFTESLELIKERNHFSGSHLSFPFQPVTFLGIVLGVKSLYDDDKKQDYRDWLLSVLKERNQRGNISGFHGVFYKYIESRLSDREVSIGDLEHHTSLEELSFIEWGRSRGHFTVTGAPDLIEKSRNSIVQLFVRADLKKMDPEHLPLVWFSADSAVSRSTDALVIAPGHLSALLKAFPAAMKRWRYDEEKSKDPIRWPVKSEREVQDIMWLMLRPYFKDLIDEETLPKLGHSAYKPDFAIPSLRTLLEVKYVRKKGDFKTVEKEILEDSVAYLTNTKDYGKLIVFIYDHSSSVQEHEVTMRDLCKVSNITDVVIVSRPSQLPSGTMSD